MSLPADPISEIKTIILTVIFIALLAIIGYLAYTKSLLNTEVAQQETEIVQYKAANTDWETQNKTCTNAVQALKDEATAREKETAIALASAQKQSQEIENAAATLMKQAPPKGDDDCEATKAFAKSYYGRKP